MLKTCSICKIEKEITANFYVRKDTKSGYRSACKDCISAKAVEDYNKPGGKDAKQSYYQQNASRIIERVRVYNTKPGRRERIKDLASTPTAIAKRKAYFQIPEVAKRQRSYMIDYRCRPEYKEAAYANKQKPEYKCKQKVYAHKRNKSPEIVAAKKLRMKTDIPYRLSVLARSRFSHAIRDMKANKYVSSIKELGCTILELKAYLESKFLPNMTWDNHGRKEGQWSIDHIRPFASFDFTDPIQQAQAVHYTNLQPLWHIDNLKKGPKWDGKTHKFKR